MVVGKCWTLILRERVFFQLLRGHLNCFFELGVMTCSYEGGIVIDVEVGRNSMVLDIPFAFEVVESEVRSGYATSVDQFGKSEDAYEAAPGALAD